MYQVSEEYKQLVYADNTNHILNIYMEENKINSDHILEFKLSHQLLDKDEFSLGSVSAKTVEIKVYKDSLPSSYQNFYIETGIGEEIVPIGYFTLEDIQWEDDGKIITIKAIDYMVQFEFNYDGSNLNYPCTLLEVLQDICLKAGVELRFYFFFKRQ